MAKDLKATITQERIGMLEGEPALSGMHSTQEAKWEENFAKL